MRRYLYILLWLASVIVPRAATISGSVVGLTGHSAGKAEVRLDYLDAPTTHEAALILASPIVTKSAFQGGTFGPLQVVPGRFKLTITELIYYSQTPTRGRVDTFQIT